jgi:hypothetical protein
MQRLRRPDYPYPINDFLTNSGFSTETDYRRRVSMGYGTFGATRGHVFNATQVRRIILTEVSDFNSTATQ